MKIMTERELQVIKLLSEGKSNKQIANELFISFHTVKAILETIYEKTGLHNRVLLAIYATKYYIKK